MIELFTDCRHKNRDSDLSVSRLLNFFKTFVKSQCRTVLATSNAIIQLLNKEEYMMKEAYAQSIECEEPCEGKLISRYP